MTLHIDLQYKFALSRTIAIELKGNLMEYYYYCKGQKRAKRPKAVMDPSPRSPNNEFVESRNKS